MPTTHALLRHHVEWGSQLLGGASRAAHLFICPETHGPFRLGGKEEGTSLVFSDYLHGVVASLGFPSLKYTPMNSRFMFVDHAEASSIKALPEVERDSRRSTLAGLMGTSLVAWNKVYAQGTEGRSASATVAANAVRDCFG